MSLAPEEIPGLSDLALTRFLPARPALFELICFESPRRNRGGESQAETRGKHSPKGLGGISPALLGSRPPPPPTVPAEEHIAMISIIGHKYLV
jgi:hypothetical protein